MGEDENWRPTYEKVSLGPLFDAGFAAGLEAGRKEGDEARRQFGNLAAEVRHLLTVIVPVHPDHDSAFAFRYPDWLWPGDYPAITAALAAGQPEAQKEESERG